MGRLFLTDENARTLNKAITSRYLSRAFKAFQVVVFERAEKLIYERYEKGVFPRTPLTDADVDSLMLDIPPIDHLITGDDEKPFWGQP